MKKYLIPAILLLLASCNGHDTLAPEYPEGQEIPQDVGLTRVYVTTINGESPTCDLVYPPEGCMGQGIANATKIGGRMVIKQKGNTLYDSGEYAEKKSGVAIRIRGNSSAWYDKKSYKLKLQKKADLLNREDAIFEDKDWILLKEDYPSINTMIGFKINQMLGMQWTPAYRFVEVILNGDYKGVYMLVESVKRKPGSRLDVAKSGYVFEFDPYWWNEPLYFETRMTQSPDAKFTFKYPDPDDITPEQVDYLREYINEMDISLTEKNNYQNYINPESFASWLLGQDILGNFDGHGSNLFMTKYDNTANSKIMMGNLWDFSAIMRTPDTWSYSHYLAYFVRMTTNSTDTTFATAYKDKWHQLSDTLLVEIRTFLEDFSNSEEGKALDRAFVLDAERWKWQSTSLQQLTKEAMLWFESRKKWLDEAVKTINHVEYPEQ